MAIAIMATAGTKNFASFISFISLFFWGIAPQRRAFKTKFQTATTEKVTSRKVPVENISSEFGKSTFQAGDAHRQSRRLPSTSTEANPQRCRDLH